MARIKEETVTRIYDTLDIVDVVGDFVSLKKRGTNFTGLCPFHNEKTPSFAVSPAKGIYKCFGCGKGGNAVDFVMEIESMSYVEALRYLADKYNIEVEEAQQSQEDMQRRDDRESMIIASEYGAKYFEHNLHQTQEGRNIGLSYFRERGFRDDIIKKFRLGYSPENPRAFTDMALKNGYKQEYLEKTGLTVNKDGRLFDRFRGRVIFPIHNLTGKVIGFGGRILKRDKKIAKYLNSPESEIYNKSRILYGFYQARREISKQGKCYLVEGYTDVLAFHQAGIGAVVASSGTSLTEQQIKMVQRITPNLTIVFDGDAAGIQASLRGIDMVLAQEMNVRIVCLPEDEDPDSFAKKRSHAELKQFLDENETDFIRFKTQLLGKQAEGDPVRRAEAIGSIIRSIAVYPNPVAQGEYIRMAAKLLDVREEALYAELKKIQGQKLAHLEKRHRTQKRQQEQKPPAPPRQKDKLALAERDVVKLLLRYGNELFIYRDEENKPQEFQVADFIFTEILGDELELTSPALKQVFEEAYKQHETSGAISLESFLKQGTEHTQLVVDLIESPYELSKIWHRGKSAAQLSEIDLDEGVPALLLYFKILKIDEMMAGISKKLAQTQDTEQQMAYLQHIHRLKITQKALSNGRVLL